MSYLKMLPILLALLTMGEKVIQAAARQWNVRDAGAAGDGRTDDTAALQKALDAAAQAGGGEVDLPAGTYLSGSLVLKSHVTLHLDKDAVIRGSANPDRYPLITARWEGLERPCHRALVSADHAEDIAITGSGTIQGDGGIGKLRDPRAPTIVEPIECRNVRVEGITLQSTQIWTLHPVYCQDVTISRVTFATSGWNSDGIDPDSCQRVRIEHCSFSTGDDNIAIKSGKGQEGARIGRPCENITISDCTFMKGTSSIALGSELSGGIRGVRVTNCIFQNGRAALYLKSRAGRGGYIRDVVAEHLIVGPEPLLEIATDYSANPDSQGIPGVAGLTHFSEIRVTDVKCAVQKLIKIQGTMENPVDGVTLSGISGTCEQGIVIRNARHVVVENITVTGITGPRFVTENAQGAGVTGATDAGGQ
jgi:polygalacturonase